MSALKLWQAVVQHEDGTREVIKVETLDRGTATNLIISRMPLHSIFITHVSEVIRPQKGRRKM